MNKQAFLQGYMYKEAAARDIVEFLQDHPEVATAVLGSLGGAGVGGALGGWRGAGIGAGVGGGAGYVGGRLSKQELKRILAGNPPEPEIDESLMLKQQLAGLSGRNPRGPEDILSSFGQVQELPETPSPKAPVRFWERPTENAALSDDQKEKIRRISGRGNIDLSTILSSLGK
jgi:hypothetical protein